MYIIICITLYGVVINFYKQIQFLFEFAYQDYRVRVFPNVKVVFSPSRPSVHW